MNTGSFAVQVSLLHVHVLPIIPSPTTGGSLPSLYHVTHQRGRLPLRVGASPLASRLADTSGRIEFVILRT